MVRTPSPVVPLHIDASRVLGWSTAIAVHALALMLLLIPAAQPLIKPPRERLQVTWVVPPPPPPPEIIRRHPADPPRLPPAVPVTTQRVPAPLPTPTATFDEAAAVAPMPASRTAAPALEPAPAAAGPSEGAQLQYRSAPPPYPIAAIRLGQQGTVVLRIRVGTDGSPLSVSIEKSSGSRLLDQAARQQVLRHWRFVPAQVDGQIVEADGLVPVAFSLPQ